MSALKTALLVAVAPSAVTAGAIFQLHQRYGREAGRLRWENNLLRVQASQQRLAEIQVNLLTVAAPAPKPNGILRTAPAPATAPTSPPKSIEVYHNEGQATPRAALQTFAWACDRGEAETVGKLLYLEPGARTRAEAYRATLPEEARKQWKSVDAMAAAMLTFQATGLPFPNADVLRSAEHGSVLRRHELRETPRAAFRWVTAKSVTSSIARSSVVA